MGDGAAIVVVAVAAEVEAEAEWGVKNSRGFADGGKFLDTIDCLTRASKGVIESQGYGWVGYKDACGANAGGG